MFLTILGAINWGLWGMFEYDIVSDLFEGAVKVPSKIAYSIIGIAGVYSISFLFNKSLYKCAFSKKSGCCKEEHKD